MFNWTIFMSRNVLFYPKYFVSQCRKISKTVTRDKVTKVKLEVKLINKIWTSIMLEVVNMS